MIRTSTITEITMIPIVEITTSLLIVGVDTDDESGIDEQAASRIANKKLTSIELLGLFKSAGANFATNIFETN